MVFSAAVTTPFTGFSSAAEALSPRSMKNAPAPPPPRMTSTRAMTIIIIVLDFFGASAVSLLSAISRSPLSSVVRGGGRGGGLGRPLLLGLVLSGGLAGVQLAVRAGRRRQQCRLVRGELGEDDDVHPAVHLDRAR